MDSSVCVDYVNFDSVNKKLNHNGLEIKNNMTNVLLCQPLVINFLCYLNLAFWQMIVEALMQNSKNITKKYFVIREFAMQW